MGQLYVSVGYLGALFDYMRVHGWPLQPLLQVLNLREQDLLDGDLKLLGVGEEMAFLAAQQLTGDPHIATHVGMDQLLVNHGILGHLVMTCANMKQVLAMHLRYRSLIGNTSIPEYRIEGAFTSLLLSRRSNLPELGRHAVEYAFSKCWSIVRWLTEGKVHPVEVTFRHREPVDMDELGRLYGCPVRFGCTDNSIRFPSELIDWPLPHGDVELSQVLELEAARRLQRYHGIKSDADPLFAMLGDYIQRSLIHGGVPGIEAAASALHLSTRRLQRELERRHTSYRDLAERIRRDLAERYIGDPQLPLVDVAMMLGFSEQSAFQRAFRRWFEATPGQYRRSIEGPRRIISSAPALPGIETSSC